MEIINESFNLTEIMEKSCHEILHYFDCDRCIFLKYADQNLDEIQLFHQTVSHPQIALIEESTIPVHSHVLLRGPIDPQQPNALMNLASPNQFPEFYRPFAERYGVQAVIGFEVTYQSKTFGRLVLHQCSRSRCWSSEELQLLQEISRILGVAISQIQLYQNVVDAEQRFRLLTEEVKDYSIYLEDPDGLIHTWNAGAERLFGYQEHEIIGKPFSIFLTQEELDSGLFKHELETAAREGRFEVEGWRKRKDGSEFWAHVIITALRDNENQLFGYSSITRDMTESRQAYSALIQSEARFRQLVDANIIGIIFWTVEGGITDANDAFLEMLGYTRSDLEAGLLNWRKLTPSDFNGVDDQYIQDLHLKGRMEPFEKQYIAKDGHRVDILVTGALLAGSSTEGVAFVLDITQKKQAERALLESQRKLAESNRDLEQFAAVASHDLQAPLRKVRTFCDMIYDGAKDKVDTTTLDLIDRSKLSLAAAQNMVRDLLALSVVKKETRPFGEVDLGQVIDRVLFNLDQEIKQKQAKITIHSAATVWGDEAQLEQLIQNLIGNALKYQPLGQTPEIQIESACFNPTFCELSIQDNGIGIPQEKADQIFEPFERLHGKKSQYEGTGIGLAICKRIVECHGGNITVESEPGQGAKFIVRLPYRSEVHRALQESAR